MRKSIVNFVLSIIYSLFESLDKKMGWYEEYQYETAPYCGHHHSGHNGYFTESHYHEGEGGRSLGNRWFVITGYGYGDYQDEWGFRFKFLPRLYDLKRMWNTLEVNIYEDDPQFVATIRYDRFPGTTRIIIIRQPEEWFNHHNKEKEFQFQPVVWIK